MEDAMSTGSPEEDMTMNPAVGAVRWANTALDAAIWVNLGWHTNYMGLIVPIAMPIKGLLFSMHMNAFRMPKPR